MVNFSALGQFDMPSKNWWVTYNGGITLVAGVHEFIVEVTIAPSQAQ